MPGWTKIPPIGRIEKEIYFPKSLAKLNHPIFHDFRLDKDFYRQPTERKHWWERSEYYKIKVEDELLGVGYLVYKKSYRLGNVPEPFILYETGSKDRKEFYTIMKQQYGDKKPYWREANTQILGLMFFKIPLKKKKTFQGELLRYSKGQ